MSARWSLFGFAFRGTISLVQESPHADRGFETLEIRPDEVDTAIGILTELREHYRTAGPDVIKVSSLTGDRQ